MSCFLERTHVTNQNILSSMITFRFWRHQSKLKSSFVWSCRWTKTPNVDQQWYIFQAWICLMAVSTINLQFKPTGYLVKTFWLVGASVSKYSQYRKKKRNYMKRSGKWWYRSCILVQRITLFHVCRPWTAMKYASHWAQIKPDGVWMVLHQFIMTAPRKIT